MKSQRYVVAALAAIISVASIAADDSDNTKAAAKRADIRRIMEVTGAAKLGLQIMNQMIAVFNQDSAEIPDKFWEDFMAEVDPNDLVELTIPIYEKHFSHDEIKQMLAFYETPLGRKLIETQPALMRDSLTVGQEWGRALGEKAAKKLQSRAEAYKQSKRNPDKSGN